MSTKNTDFLDKIASLKAILDNYRPFPEHVVKQPRDYYRLVPPFTR